MGRIRAKTLTRNCLLFPWDELGAQLQNTIIPYRLVGMVVVYSSNNEVKKIPFLYELTRRRNGIGSDTSSQ